MIFSQFWVIFGPKKQGRFLVKFYSKQGDQKICAKSKKIKPEKLHIFKKWSLTR